VKDRDWILRKKDRMKRQGKQVKADSKYSGRKRASGF
jgi:18S rRNA (guanine1575-N7)-methyltransferase